MKLSTGLVRDAHFSKIASVRPDGKRRVTLKKVAVECEHYMMYVNAKGQILLDPQVSVPASEAWLYKNEAALDAVKEGLRQSAEGKLVSGRSFAKYADDEID